MIDKLPSNPKFPTKNKRKAHYSKYRTGSIVGLVIFILIFGGIGLRLLIGSKAATPLVSTAPTDAAATGGEVCPGGAQASQLVSPHTSAPANGYRGTTSTVVISGDAKPAMTPNTTYYFTTGTHKVGQLIPQSRDVFVGAPGAILDGNNTSENAFASYADNASYVTIEFLTIKNYHPQQDQWVINTDSGANWTITHNTIGPNTRGAGLGLGDNGVITYNCITRNGQYGINGYDNNDNVVGNDHSGTRGGPVKNVTISHNQIDTNDVYTIPDPDGSGPLPAGCPGCGYDNYPTPDVDVSQCPYPADCGVSGGAKFWNEVDLMFDHNVVTDNHHTGIWADTSNQNNVYDNNYFGGNWGIAIWYEVSYNPTITNNKFVKNAIVDGAREKSKLDGAIYFSESGYDSRVDGGRGGTASTACGTCAEVSGNVFQDNWSGVAEWENPNRYCSNGLPTTNCTLVNPATATLTSCSKTKSNGGLEPNSPVHYVSPTDSSYDCRWRTKNIYVNNNNFAYSPGVVNTALTNLATNGDAVSNNYRMSSNLCTVTNGCGFNITVSQWGSAAFWPKDLVPNAITFEQNLKYDYNTYYGDWHFDVHELGGTNLTPTQWKTGQGSTDTSSGDHSGDNINHPSQDVHSTFNGIPPPPPDTTPPTVTISSPANGSTVSGTVTLAATASDNVGVTKVTFSVGSVIIGTDTTSPYSASWNTTSVSNGSHTIVARAFDAANNTSTDSNVVTVSNGDIQPPSTPTGLHASAPAYNRVNLSWTASTDNVGVAGYYVVRGGTTIAKTVGTGVTYADSTVSPSTSYSYKVMAYDAKGNTSALSSAALVTTPAQPDTQAPTAPANLTGRVMSDNQVNLSWGASTDNIGVTGYDVYYANGGINTLEGKRFSSSTLSAGISGLAPNTKYAFVVVAHDAAGNTSKQSNVVYETTMPYTAPANIAGVVTSSAGGVVAGATITIHYFSFAHTYTTNSLGQYFMGDVAVKTYPAATYEAVGFTTKQISITTISGQTIHVNVTLQKL